MRHALLLVAALTISTTAVADKLAVVGAKVYTLTSQGTLENASVLINNGKIEKVIEGVSIPQGYEVIDGAGKVVTPGFVGAYTQLGLVEVNSSAGVVDSSVEPIDVSGTGAALDVSYAVNPDSTLFAVSRIEGFTSAATSISWTEQLFAGQGAVISLADSDSVVLKPRAFITVNVGNGGAEEQGGSRAALWVALEEALSEADSVSDSINARSDWHGVNKPADIAPLKKVLAGDIPLLMRADRAADIRQIIAFKKRHKAIRVVLLHGVEAWRVADELAAHDIPVIIDPEYNLPGGFDQLGATLANAGRLVNAGVKVAIGMDTHNIRLATQHAGNAVANGMPYDAALASLTTVPAMILGMDKQIGSLSPGANADVVIWSGDPLEVTQAAEQVLINGKKVSMESRQTKLKDRYLSLSQDKSGATSHYMRP